MPKLRLAIPLLAIVPLFAACGGGITVQVSDADTGDVVENLEVQFLPFDRDSLFAAIAANAPTPEPQMPAELQAATDSVRVLNEAWRAAETAWNTARDSLRQINDALQGLDRRSVEYRQLFDRFTPMENRERAANRARQAAFDAMDSFQQATQQQVDSVRIIIQSWEEVAFADYGDIEADLLAALGREIAVDTTDEAGVAFAGAAGGPWWIHARTNVAGGELYWNFMVDGASSDTVRLNPGNAELRRSY